MSGKKKIAGMHVSENGDIALVWLEYDPTVDEIVIYDSCVFKVEVPVVIAEGINARGRWIPVTWANKAMSDQLLERGCKMLPDPADDSDAMAEIVSRDMWERMRSRRLKADKRLRDWFDEAKSLQRTKNKIPKDSHPLMAATRLAVQQIKYARRLQPARPVKHRPQVAIV